MAKKSGHFSMRIVDWFSMDRVFTKFIFEVLLPSTIILTRQCNIYNRVICNRIFLIYILMIHRDVPRAKRLVTVNCRQ
ncbi:hypothetical protein C495_14727 [Natronorubrum sulfidifaciens JCM 14089]|uniref:Uncharacterized protein n=1 Tax=Natronorubrum sulfidifaciens JCM 14089 TaxID=1230460 RepID=L9VZT5_9EURY|nr:hypothetical protein C495_14727 [Natronorubrum sulfidifaciens JCM 14089]